MENSLELKGLWWLPSCPDKKNAGILRYVRTKDTTLELIGAFQDGDWLLDGHESHRYDIIHGATSDGKDISIIASIPFDASFNTSCSFPVVKYFTPLVLQGKRLQNTDERFLSRITVS